MPQHPPRPHTVLLRAHRPRHTFVFRALLAATAALCALPAMAQSSTGTMDTLRAACSDDAARFCSNVQSGGGRIVSCLKQHKEQLSNGCRQAAGLPPRPGQPQAQPSQAQPPQTQPPQTQPQAQSPSPSQPLELTPVLDPQVLSPSSQATASDKPTHVAGETFTRRVIADQAHDNAMAATIRLPEKWLLASKIVWHYDQTENPVALGAQAANPANSEAFFLYPLFRSQWIEVSPQYRQYLRGQQSQAGARAANGTITTPPQQPMQALITFIKQMRAGAGNLKFVGQQKLPDLAKVLNLPPWGNDQGIAIKISYDLKGKPVEEAFFGVFYLSQGGSPAKTVGQIHLPANVIKQTNWGIRNLQSFRAPAGTLDPRMPVFCLISKSLVYNPQWLKMGNQIHDQLVAAVQQKIEQGYDQIRAGQAAMQQMQANEKAVDASVTRFDAALRAPGFDDSWLRTSGGGGVGSGGKLSNVDGADNNIRSQSTARDPNTGENKQLSNAGDYHFTDGFGNYRTSSDPNYTPEKAGESGSWTLMQNVQ